MKKYFFVKSPQLFTALFTGSFLFLFSSCDNNNKPTETPKAEKVINEKVEGKSENQPVSIAYVNLDSLETQYDQFKEAKTALERRQTSMENQIKKLAQDFENEYMAFQQKYQSGTLTQAEGEAAQKKLESMQMNLERKREELATQLLKEQEQFTKNLQNQLDSFLTKYNEDKKYDYILSHMQGGGILLANPALDITEEVLKGMNEMFQSDKKDKK